MYSLKNSLINPFKLNHNPDNILFTGCLHFGHKCDNWELPLWKRRGFSSVMEHDQSLMQRWNARANKSTVAFLLGDSMFGAGGIRRFEEILINMNFGQMFVLPGNHTAGHRQLLESCQDNLYYSNGRPVVFMPNYMELFINGQSAVLSHYPILSYNGMGRGAVHCFAHVHGNLSNSALGELYLKSCRAVEVSVEAAPNFLTWSEIMEKVKDKEPFAPDHHGVDTNNPF